MNSVQLSRFVQSPTTASWPDAKGTSSDLLVRTPFAVQKGILSTRKKRPRQRSRSERPIRACSILHSPKRAYLDVRSVPLPPSPARNWCLAKLKTPYLDGSASGCRKPDAPASNLCAATSQLSPLKLENLNTIVINLDSRSDRMSKVTEQLTSHCPGLPFKRFFATDGRKTEILASEVSHSWNTSQNVHYQRLRSIRKGWDDVDSYHACNLKMSGGERGCASSHIRAWQHCLEQASLAGQETQPLLVLEDDADPMPEFSSILRRALVDLPNDAHLLYLGYSQAAEWRREISPELVEAEYVWTTVGYIIWPAGARMLLSNLPVNAPVDNWMAGRCASRDINAYCVRPKIIRQAEGWNEHSDVCHSDESYWDPEIYEPLLIVGSLNQWSTSAAKVTSRFDHTNASDTTATTQESSLRLKCTGEQISFQIVSARKLWDFRLHPRETADLACDGEPEPEVCLMVGKDHSVAAGKNFVIDTAVCSGFVTIRVVQNRDHFRVWYSKDLA